MIFLSSAPTNRHCVPIPQPPPIAATTNVVYNVTTFAAVTFVAKLAVISFNSNETPWSRNDN